MRGPVARTAVLAVRGFSYRSKRSAAAPKDRGPQYARHIQARGSEPLPPVQITVATVGHKSRLRRLTCGKALPFRRTPDRDKLLGAGWKAEPSSLRREAGEGSHRPESRRLSPSQRGRAAVSLGVFWQFGQACATSARHTPHHWHTKTKSVCAARTTESISRYSSAAWVFPPRAPHRTAGIPKAW